jgi:exopolysaccharide production protein ExoQ
MVLLNYLPEVAGFLLLIMSATQLPSVGPILILGQFAIIGLLTLRYTTVFAQAGLKWWWLLLSPAFALVSALWSEVPLLSARYAAQLLFSCYVGVFLALLLSPRRYILTLMAAMFVFCILCIVNGRQGTSADGWVLIGLTGSKNQMGYVAQILLMSAIATLTFKNVATPLRWIALLSLPLSVFLLAGTNSATAVLMAVGGTFVLLSLWWAERLPPGGRVFTLLALLLILAPLTMLTPEAIEAFNHFMFNTLNKDPTLTGRTLLWERADHLIAQRPLFGYGFQSVWMSDSSETIGLRRLTNITDGRTFHFHDSFRQAAVDTGYIGLAAFIGVMVAAGLASMRTILLRPSVANSFFVVLFALMVTRAFTDMLLGPFSIHTLLYFACCVYAFWRPEMEIQDAPLAGVRRAPMPYRAAR